MLRKQRLGAAAGTAGRGVAGQNWAVVLFVNDSDTITVRANGRKELVRLLGVDALETNHSNKLLRAAHKAGRTPQEEAHLSGWCGGMYWGSCHGAAACVWRPTPARASHAPRPAPRGGGCGPLGRSLEVVYEAQVPDRGQHTLRMVW